MKKILLILSCVLLCGLFTACGSDDKATSSSDSEPESTSDSSTEKTETSKRDFPEGDYSDTGNGSFYVSTASGTSEDGSTPVVFVAGDTSLMDIGYGASEFDGSHLSYIYSNGMLLAKEQLGDSQGSLTLQDDFLSPGVYKVEVVQYDNDQPDGNIITYKTCNYEIKPE